MYYIQPIISAWMNEFFNKKKIQYNLRFNASKLLLEKRYAEKDSFPERETFEGLCTEQYESNVETHQLDFRGIGHKSVIVRIIRGISLFYSKRMDQPSCSKSASN